MTPELIAAKLALRLAEQEAHEAADRALAAPMNSDAWRAAYAESAVKLRKAAELSIEYVRMLGLHLDSLARPRCDCGRPATWKDSDLCAECVQDNGESRSTRW